MRRQDTNQFVVAFGVDPPTKNTTARKDKGMDVVTIDHGKLKLTIKGRAGDPLPFHYEVIAWEKHGHFDLDHTSISWK